MHTLCNLYSILYRNMKKKNNYQLGGQIKVSTTFIPIIECPKYREEEQYIKVYHP